MTFNETNNITSMHDDIVDNIVTMSKSEEDHIVAMTFTEISMES